MDDPVSATSQNSGLTEGSHCSICGAIIVPQTVIPAIGSVEVVEEYVPLVSEVEAGNEAVVENMITVASDSGLTESNPNGNDEIVIEAAIPTVVDAIVDGNSVITEETVNIQGDNSEIESYPEVVDDENEFIEPESEAPGNVIDNNTVASITPVASETQMTAEQVRCIETITLIGETVVEVFNAFARFLAPLISRMRFLPVIKFW